jgi:hypothetical protein
MVLHGTPSAAVLDLPLHHCAVNQVNLTCLQRGQAVSTAALHPLSISSGDSSADDGQDRRTSSRATGVSWVHPGRWF